MDKPKYFCHGGKLSKFDSDEKKMFINFINSKDKYGNIRWNWAAGLWDGFAQNEDSNMQLIKISKIPDYTKLETE